MMLKTCMVLKDNELESVHVKHGKCMFVLRSRYPRILNIGPRIEKDSRLV